MEESDYDAKEMFRKFILKHERSRIAHEVLKLQKYDPAIIDKDDGWHAEMKPTKDGNWVSIKDVIRRIRGDTERLIGALDQYWSD